jgi:hypothetical protein
MFIKKKYIVIYFILLVGSMWFSTLAMEFGRSIGIHDAAYYEALFDACIEASGFKKC